MFYFLIFAILFSTITHAALSFKKYLPYLQGQMDEYTIQNPVNEWLRFASISFLTGYPIFLFSTLKSWHIESNLLNQMLLVVILLISVLFIVFSKKHLWSEKFEANIKPCVPLVPFEEALLEVEELNNINIKKFKILFSKTNSNKNNLIKQQAIIKSNENSIKQFIKNKSDVEKNLTKKKPGRQYSTNIELVLKKLLFQEFDKKEKIAIKYDHNYELFFDDVYTNTIQIDKDFNRNSFRTCYYRIKKGSLDVELKNRKKYAINLLKDPEISKFDQINTYLTKILQ